MGARDAIAKLISGGIRAFHSSPHDFERFDLSKIGTGEGAQVYGHGIYAAENPAVSGQGGQYWQQFAPRFSGPEGRAVDYLRNFNMDRDKATRLLASDLRDMGSRLGRDVPAYKEHQEALRLLESGAPVDPRTYEVNIKADPAHMLDWDKPISQNSPYVQDALRDARLYSSQSKPLALSDMFDSRGGLQEKTGQQLYRGLATPTGRNISLNQGAIEATDRLGEAGIPGIKYLDEGSRLSPQSASYASQFGSREEAHAAALQALQNAKGREAVQWQDKIAELGVKPTSNYVVFDPANIDILKKYGIAGAAAAPVVGAAMGDTYDQSQYEAPP